MKEYIKDNWKSILIGYAIATTFYFILNLLEDVILSIAILLTK